MPHAHDLFHFALLILGPGGDFKTFGQCLPGHHQGMIASGGERARQAGEHPLAGMVHRRGLAVHHLPGTHHLSTERLPQGLMSQTDAENRQLAGEMANRLHGNTGLVGRAGPRRDHQPVRPHRLHPGQINLVITMHQHLGPQFLQVLDQVIGEAVIVIDHQDPHQRSPSSRLSPPRAMFTARNTARALFMVSFHSRSGWESATTPPPACT